MHGEHARLALLIGGMLRLPRTLVEDLAALFVSTWGGVVAAQAARRRRRATVAVRGRPRLFGAARRGEHGPARCDLVIFCQPPFSETRPEPPKLGFLRVDAYGSDVEPDSSST